MKTMVLAMAFAGVLLAGHGHAASYNFTAVTGAGIPSSNSVTAAWGVGVKGTLVGGVPVNGVFSAFIYRKGKLTTFADPNASFTLAHAIAPDNTIVGETTLPGNQISGFIYSPAGAFTIYTYPGAVYTRYTGINKAHDIAGNYYDGSFFHGIINKGGTVTQFDFPGGHNTACTSINDHDEVVGQYQDSSGVTHGYSLINGKAKSFDYPGATYTDARGVNDQGDIGGFYTDSAGATHGFVRSKKGVFTSIDYPGAVSTTVYGINSHGEIAGQAQTGDGSYTPYYATTH